jgi:hypothetical protein
MRPILLVLLLLSSCIDASCVFDEVFIDRAGSTCILTVLSNADRVMINRSLPLQDECTLSADWDVLQPCNATCTKAGTVVMAKQVLERPLTREGCDMNDLVRIEECDPLWMTTDCDVDCIMSNWTHPSECDPVSSMQNSTRTVIREARNNGVPCPTDQGDLVHLFPCVPDRIAPWMKNPSIAGGETTVQAHPNGSITLSALVVDTMISTTVRVQKQGRCSVPPWTQWSPCFNPGVQYRFRDIKWVGPPPQERCGQKAFQSVEGCTVPALFRDDANPKLTSHRSETVYTRDVFLPDGLGLDPLKQPRVLHESW